MLLLGFLQILFLCLFLSSTKEDSRYVSSIVRVHQVCSLSSKNNRIKKRHTRSTLGTGGTDIRLPRWPSILATVRASHQERTILPKDFYFCYLFLFGATFLKNSFFTLFLFLFGSVKEK